jgi:hypothetical protein
LSWYIHCVYFVDMTSSKNLRKFLATHSMGVPKGCLGMQSVYRTVLE